MTRLALITDSHLGPNANFELNGINVQRRLEQVLAAVSDWQPDLLIATGDLANGAEANAYRRLAGLLGQLGIPVLVIPGNHDDGARMRALLCGGDIHWESCHRLNDWELILLDSVVRQAPHGRVNPETLAQLKADRGTLPAMAFVHHHPVAVGSAWIDAMMLHNGDQLLDALPGRVRALFCGHVHQNFHALHGDTALLATASTCYQILPGVADFAIDSGEPDPVWRSIELAAGGRWRSAVRRACR